MLAIGEVELLSDADVRSARARRVARVCLQLKLDGLTFLQVVEHAAGQCRGVEEDVLTGVVSLDESKASIANEAGDLTGCQCCFSFTPRLC